MLKASSSQAKTEEEGVIEEIGYLIGSKGDMQYEKNQQEIKEIDEEQDQLLERHKEVNEKYKGRYSKEKIEILEKDIDLLWKKSSESEQLTNFEDTKSRCLER